MACARSGRPRPDRAEQGPRPRASRMPCRSGRVKPRTSLAPSACVVRSARRPSSLRPVIGAALVAAVAMHADAGDLTGVLQPLPDEAREVFQRRRTQRLDAIEQLVVEHLAYIGDA